MLDRLTMSVSEKDLAKALSNLVTIQPDTVTVMKEHSGNTYKFTVTFKSDRGGLWRVVLWPLVGMFWNLCINYVKLVNKVFLVNYVIKKLIMINVICMYLICTYSCI